MKNVNYNLKCCPSLTLGISGAFAFMIDFITWCSVVYNEMYTNLIKRTDMKISYIDFDIFTSYLGTSNQQEHVWLLNIKDIIEKP
jgi:hypothetical protein